MTSSEKLDTAAEYLATQVASKKANAILPALRLMAARLAGAVRSAVRSMVRKSGLVAVRGGAGKADTGEPPPRVSGDGATGRDGGGHREPAARAFGGGARRLRLGPRSRSLIRGPLRPHVRSGTADINIVEKDVDKAVDKGRGLAEWHDMTPGQQQASWAELRAWVAWLYDRYELGTEDRLPRCWARPSRPGRGTVGTAGLAAGGLLGGQPAGQAARYWHTELRQLVQAAVPMYAAGCRTGHRGASTLAADDPEFAEEWARAYPLAGTPGIDIAAGRARLAGECLTTAAVAAALDSGDASAVPLLRDYIFYAGGWWVPASSGWVKVPRPGRAGESFPLSPHTPGTTSPDPASSGDPWQG